MCMEYSQYADKIKKYCEDNKLNFSKISQMIKGCGSDDIIIQYHDKTKGMDGLRNESRMPVVLRIKRQGDTVAFEQTEYTRKYLT